MRYLFSGIAPNQTRWYNIILRNQSAVCCLLPLPTQMQSMHAFPKHTLIHTISRSFANKHLHAIHTRRIELVRVCASVFMSFCFMLWPLVLVLCSFTLVNLLLNLVGGTLLFICTSTDLPTEKEKKFVGRSSPCVYMRYVYVCLKQQNGSHGSQWITNREK